MVTPRRIIVEADGGSRGNPGPAGYGALVRDAETGEVIAERAAAIGVATNNVAEYQGLIAGLRAAAEVAPDADLEVRMDSKLVVEQMSGRWQVKHPAMKPLAREAAALAAARPRIRYQWIPRARNAAADRLANEAMDAAAAGRTWTSATSRSLPEPSDARPPSLDARPPSLFDQALDEAAAQTSTSTARSSSSATSASSTSATARPATARPATARPATSTAASALAAGSGAVAASAATSSTGRGSGWGAPSVPATDVVLLRHGQTRISVEKRFGGTIDVDLTAVGRAQAQAAAERLSGEYFDAIVVSPLKRARQTAAALAGDLDPAVEVIIDEGLRETDFGVFEGRTFAEARESHPDEFAAWRADVAVPPPGGESLLATTERVRETVAKHVAARPGERLLFVTHMGPIKAATALALGVGPGVFYRLHLDLASLTTITWYGDSTAVLHGFNDVRHLPPGALAGE